MRRNDFFKYLLLGGRGSASRVELESETLPYTFVSKSQRLRNYRIYGNTVDGESVGDLVTEGDHAGEYCVPVKIEGKNLWNVEVENKSINGTDGSLYGDSTRLANTQVIKLNSGTYTINYKGVSMVRIAFYGDSSTASFTRITNWISGSATFNLGSEMCIRFAFSDGGNTITPSDIFNIQLERGSQATEYEPYHEPQAVNIELDEPLGEGEYIDFREQKQYFADETSENVSLPAIPTIDGTNIISVETTVQPSKIWIQGNISEIETVSVQALQTNMRSLQPLSIDDENLELDVKPIEKPVLNLNDVSEIENAEIERGVESAE